MNLPTPRVRLLVPHWSGWPLAESVVRALGGVPWEWVRFGGETIRGRLDTIEVPRHLHGLGEAPPERLAVIVAEDCEEYETRRRERERRRKRRRKAGGER